MEASEPPDVAIENPPSVRFLNIVHSPEHVKPVWEEASKADIVLMELTNETQENKMVISELVNMVSSIKDSNIRKERVARIHEQGIWNGKGFFAQICTNAMLDGKLLFFIDTDLYGENDAARFEAESKESKEKSRELFNSGRFAESLDYFKLSSITQAQGDLEREYDVKDQVEYFVQSNMDILQGKKLAVIQGMWHSRTYRRFKEDNPNIPSSRTFPEPRVTYTLSKEVNNRIGERSRGDLEDTYKKAFIARYIVSYEIHKIFGDLWDRDKIVEVTDKIARSLTQDEIELVFKKLDLLERGLEKYRQDRAAFKISLNKTLDIIGQSVLESKNHLLANLVAPGVDKPRFLD